LINFQTKKRPLIHEFYNVKKEAYINRYFIINKGMTFLLSEKIYCLLYSTYNTSFMTMTNAWSEQQSLILHFKCSSDSSVVIKCENSIIMVEFSGLRSETILFSNFCEFIRGILKSCFYRAEYDEVIECKCASHTYFVEDLFDGFMQNKKHVMCHHISKSLLIENMAPDLTLPRLKSYHDRYIEGEKLGVGAFGSVSKGELKEGGSPIAIKRFNSFGTEEGTGFVSWEVFLSFQYEALIACGLNNKFLVRQFGIDLRELVLIQELIPHDTLGNLLYKNKGRDDICIQLRKKFCRDIAQGLTYLHSTKPPLIHRDLRSYNIFLSSLDDNVEVNAKIGDFGLSTYAYTKLAEPLESWQW
jgi:hypothetical protein